MEPLNLCYLPTEILVKICSHLSYKDLTKVGATCRRLREVGCHDSLWKRFCQHYWITSEKCDEEELWKTHFGHHYVDFSDYMPVYPQLKSAWNQLETFLWNHCPFLASSLLEGASEQQLNEVEQKLGIKLPLEVRCFYRIHNGQDHGALKGVFGSVPVQNFTRSEIFLNTSSLMDPLNYVLHSGSLAISRCHLTQLKICVALQDYPDMKSGSIFHLPNHNQKAFYLGSSLISWFSLFVEQVVTGEFVIQDKLIYRMSGAKQFQATTAAITVSVSCAFLPEATNIEAADFWFAYRITMEMSPTATQEDICLFGYRHWVICNEREEKKHVHGPGVVGQFPLMTPASKHTWVSFTKINTPSGYMEGHFTMTNIVTFMPLEVECPRFDLKAPPYVDLKESATVQLNNS